MAAEQDIKSSFKLARLANLSTSDFTIIEKVLEQDGDINFAIPANSLHGISKPHVIGYTALHFACTKNINLYKCLLNHGADFTKKDQNGNTPLHSLIINKKDIKELLNDPFVNATLSAHVKWNNFFNPCNKNRLSHFHIACMTDNETAVQFFLNNGVSVDASVSMNSELFPGYTALHFSAMCTNTKIVEILIAHGANTHLAASKGKTVLHILVQHKLEKITHLRKYLPSHEHSYKEIDKIINMLIKNKNSDIDHYVDSVGLSNFHVACILSDPMVAEQLADQETDLNHCVDMDSPLWPGYTALHFAARVSIKLVGVLIRKGASMQLQDLKGLTPLDICIMLYKIEDVCEIMSLNVDWGNIVFSDIYTHLSDSQVFNHFTSNTFSSSCAPDNSLILDNFILQLQKNNQLQKSMRRKFGWTNLHLACYSLQIDGFEKLVKTEMADVNAKVFLDSPIWKGYTPLHLLLYRSLGNKAYKMSRILLENGADITAIDNERKSPISMLAHFDLYLYSDKPIHTIAALLMEYYRDFDVNIKNAYGVSYFHLACYLNDLNAVKGFLSRSVDVNHPIDFFASSWSGQTPLHLTSQLEVINLLISNGADVNKEDVSGCSVLATALSREIFDKDVVTKLIECGANINSFNFNGQTPFEITLLKSEITMEKLEFCIKQGFHVNSCNPISGIGYIAIFLEKCHYFEDNLKMSIVEAIANENASTILGRTTLHNIVAGDDLCMSVDNFLALFEKVLKSGCDIDAQDDNGKTALYLAMESNDESAVKGLLRFGPDINILDAMGEPALFYDPYCSAWYTDYTSFLKYICKLAFLKLDLTEVNAFAISEINKNDYITKQFIAQVAKTKKMYIGVRSIVLHSFLTETGAITKYFTFNQVERTKTHKFFEKIDKDTSLNEIHSILKLQYRKAVKRVRLLSLSTNSFRLLLGFDLPDLCAENIFQYLRNSELTNLIKAAIEN